MSFLLRLFPYWGKRDPHEGPQVLGYRDRGLHGLDSIHRLQAQVNDATLTVEHAETRYVLGPFLKRLVADRMLHHARFRLSSFLRKADGFCEERRQIAMAFQDGAPIRIAAFGQRRLAIIVLVYEVASPQGGKGFPSLGFRYAHFPGDVRRSNRSFSCATKHHDGFQVILERLR